MRRQCYSRRMMRWRLCSSPSMPSAWSKRIRPIQSLSQQCIRQLQLRPPRQRRAATTPAVVCAEVSLDNAIGGAQDGQLGFPLEF